MATDIKSGASSDLLTINSNKQALVLPAIAVLPSGVDQAAQVGSVRIVSTNDDGIYLGTASLLSPETDDDYRLRVSHDTLLDNEEFVFAQNTGKHTFSNTTLAATFTNAGITVNSGSVNTANIGLTIGTYATFPIHGTQTTVCETVMGWNAAQTANIQEDFGIFLRGGTTLFAPLDGFYFRLSSDGLKGCYNFNGAETESGLFPFTIVPNRVYKFLIQHSNVALTFWVDNDRVAEIARPVSVGAFCISQSLPWSYRRGHTGTTGNASQQAIIKSYRISTRGAIYSDSLSEVNGRMQGTYQGLSGGTMGTIGTYTNSTNPTAAVPSNTALTVGATGLLNQAWETFSGAVNTDLILLSYQMPSASVTSIGKRYKIIGVKLCSFVQTVLVGGPLVRTFSLAFGHTSVSLATAEAATTKARRIVLLPELTQYVTAAQAVSTAISQPLGGHSMLSEEAAVFVNAGEFVQVAVKGIGTVGVSGTIVNHIQLVYIQE